MIFFRNRIFEKTSTVLASKYISKHAALVQRTRIIHIWKNSPLRNRKKSIHKIQEADKWHWAQMILFNRRSNKPMKSNHPTYYHNKKSHKVRQEAAMNPNDSYCTDTNFFTPYRFFFSRLVHAINESMRANAVRFIFIIIGLT